VDGMDIGRDLAARRSVARRGGRRILPCHCAAWVLGGRHRHRLRQGILILQVNRVPVETRIEFSPSLWRGKVGEPFELIISREEQSLAPVVLRGDRPTFLRSARWGRNVRSDRGPRTGCTLPGAARRPQTGSS
jgi:hypothetical protein